ncbi:MAG: replication initiation protein [Saprospiraceae bacterium]|nr:replication initiation protein [Saprospiraceae bacterium]
MTKVVVRKKKRNDRVKLIKKSNDLVEARYKFDIWEMRVFSKMITMIEIDDGDFKDYKIYLKEFIKDYSLENDKNSYRFLREGAEKLMRKIVTIINKTEPKSAQKFQTPVVAGLRTSLYDDDGKFIQVSFHPEMKPYLLELKERFLVYDVRNILKLPSTYSIRIYELLKQYEKLRTRTFNVTELKEILGINKEYKLYANFKQRVIDKAQKDLEEFTDIRFVYEEIKDGKAVVTLIFHIEPNAPMKALKAKKKVSQVELDFDTPSVEKNNVHSISKTPPSVKPNSFTAETIDFEEVRFNSSLFEEVFPMVKGWNISHEVLQLLIETQPEEAVRDGLAYTLWEEKGGKIKENIAGFFINAVKNRYSSKAFEIEKRQRARREIERKKLEFKKQLEDLSADYNAQVNEIIRKITVENPEATTLAIQIVNEENKSYFGLKGVFYEKLTVEDYRQDPILRGMVIQAIKRQHSEKFAFLEQDYRNCVAKINGEIKKLDK